MALVRESFDDYKAEIEDVIGVGDRVVTLAIETGRGKYSGAEVQTRQTAHVWTLRADRATRLELYWDRAQGVRAAGLLADPLA
jgi:ketosteroid isomerase-like protein